MMEPANITQHYDKMIFMGKEMLIADNSEETYFHFQKRYLTVFVRYLEDFIKNRSLSASRINKTRGKIRLTQ